MYGSSVTAYIVYLEQPSLRMAPVIEAPGTELVTNYLLSECLTKYVNAKTSQ